MSKWTWETDTACKKKNFQHIKKGGFKRTDLVVRFKNLVFVGDFNGITSDPGWDTKSRRERSLSGFHTSVSCKNHGGKRKDSTRESKSSNHVADYNVTNGLQASFSENKTHNAIAKKKNGPKLRNFFYKITISTPLHRVLTNENNCIIIENSTYLMPFLERNIVKTNEKNAVTPLDKSVELVKVLSFLSRYTSYFKSVGGSDF